MMYQEVYYGSVYRFDRKIPTPGQTFFKSRISDYEKDERREAQTTTRMTTKMMRTITKTRIHVIP